MTFLEAGLLFAVVCFFLFLVADRLSNLASEVKMLRGLVIAQIAEDEPKKLSAGSDPIVHDSG